MTMGRQLCHSKLCCDLWKPNVREHIHSVMFFTHLLEMLRNTKIFFPKWLPFVQHLGNMHEESATLGTVGSSVSGCGPHGSHKRQLLTLPVDQKKEGIQEHGTLTESSGNWDLELSEKQLITWLKQTHPFRIEKIHKNLEERSMRRMRNANMEFNRMTMKLSWSWGKNSEIVQNMHMIRN